MYAYSYIHHTCAVSPMSHLLVAEALAWDEPNVLNKQPPPPRLVMTVSRRLASKGRISTRCYAPS